MQPRCTAVRPTLSGCALDILGATVLLKVLQPDLHEQGGCFQYDRSIGATQSAHCVGIDLAAFNSGDPAVNVQDLAHRHRPTEVCLQSRSHRGNSQKPVQCAECLIERCRQQATVGESGRTLVMFRHLELGAYSESFGGVDPHMKPGWMVRAASETSWVVATNLRSRIGSLRVSDGKRRRTWWIGRQRVGSHHPRLVARAWHARGMSPDPDSSVGNESGDAPTKAVSGTDVEYREHLGAPIWSWLVMFVLVLSLALAFWVPLGATAGICCAVLGSALVIWLLVTTAPTITVTNRELRIGRVHIDVDYIGLVATLDADATANARGADADPRAFTVLRPLSAKESLSLEILDDEDPHPYWLLSSRDPQALGQAIRAAQQSSVSSATGSAR